MLGVGFCLVLASPSRAPGQELANGNPVVVDVPRAFDSLDPAGRPLKFSRGSIKVPPGGHLQGIQIRFDAARNRHIVFLSHDAQSIGYLVVVEFPALLSADGNVIGVHDFPSDGRLPPLRHAGGMQLCGDILAIGLEDNQDKTRSQVQFWNVADPAKPVQLRHLTVHRAGAPKDKTAGAVALVAQEADYLLAVANWDSRAIDFYRSSAKRLEEVECRFAPLARWQEQAADESDWNGEGGFGTYQAVNFVADAQGNLFLLGFDTTPAGQDVVDLFSVDLSQPAPKLLRKRARQQLRLDRDNHFRYAGGLWIDRGRMAILASPRNLAPETWLNVVR